MQIVDTTPALLTVGPDLYTMCPNTIVTGTAV